MGHSRTFSYLPGMALQLDSAICPKSFTKVLVVVYICTSYVAAYLSKDFKAQTAKKHLIAHMCSHPPPQIIITDFGSEFRDGLQDYLATHHISLQVTTPYEKGSSSTSENAIRLVKRALTKMCLFEPKNWACYLPMIVNGINSLISYIEQHHV